MLPRHAPAALLLLAFAAFLGAADAEPLDKPVVRKGMSIAFPKGWALDEPKTGHVIIVARSQDKQRDESGEFPATISVSLGAAGKPDGNAIQEANAKELKNYRSVEEPRDIDLGGATGLVLGGTFTRGALKLRTRQYILVAGDKGFVITIVMLESRWDKAHQSAEASVASFQIAEPEKK